MSQRIPVTEFAPAEREPVAVIFRQHAAIADSPLTHQVLNSVVNHVFVLNAQRQIVFASENARDWLGDKDLESVLGQRPGEALDCVHAEEHPGGCGTSKTCQACGVVKAILASLQGQATTLECQLTRILNLAPTPLDLLVSAVPFDYQGERFAILSVSPHQSELQAR